MDETEALEQAEAAFHTYVGDKYDDGIMHKDIIDTLALIALGLEMELEERMKKRRKYGFHSS